MDVHRQITNTHRPRSNNLTYSSQILHMPHDIPNLFAYAILQPLVHYYQTPSLILPLLFSSFAALCFHVPFCWTLVFKLKLGSSAAALASASSYLLDVLMLGEYMKYSFACEKTCAVFSKDVFFSMREFFHFAIPSARMVW